MKRSPRRGAFTLVELLCAIAVTLLLVVVIAQMVGSVLKMWPSSRNRLQKNMEARFALEFLAQDLSAAVIRRAALGDAAWLQTLPEKVGGGSSFSGNMTSLMFFSVPQDRQGTNGNVCAIAYRPIYQDPINQSGTNRIFGLYRSVVDAPTTFTGPLGMTNLYTGFWKTWNTANPEGFLVGHVVDFRVTFNAEATATTGTVKRYQISPTWELMVGRDLKVALPSGETPPSDPVPASARLVSADISLTILNDAMSVRLEQGLGDVNALLAEGSHSFVKHVNLPEN